MNSLHRRRAKIVCTLGPTSSSPDQIEKLIQEGLDVARLNFSHGQHEFHQGLIQTVRQKAQSLRKNVGILQDLQGPKIRVGKLPPSGVTLENGDWVYLFPEGDTPNLPKECKLSLPISAEIAHAVMKDTTPGARILFDDGKILSNVKKANSEGLVIEVMDGGILTSHKGMNLPDTPLSIACLTAKDYLDLKFGLSQDVDAIALSFVRHAQDIEVLRTEMKRFTNNPPIVIPKIERLEAVERYEPILEVSDGILIARGDMAVEIGAERVPVIQKRLIKACNEFGIPVITATQMLESMVASPTPTRAEASDVANAIFDGTDAVMLSGETASGKYPIHAVRTMNQIILEAEQAQSSYSRYPEVFPVPGSIVDAIARSSAEISEQIGAVALACITHSGMAARTLAKYRPNTPIVAIMDQESNLRRLALVWGVHGELIPKIVATDDLFAMVESVLEKSGWAEKEDHVVVTAGVPTLKRGTTNMVKVHRMGVQHKRQLR